MFRRLIRGLTANHTQLDPSADVPKLRPWTLSGITPSELFERLDQWAVSRPRWTVQSRDGGTMHLTRRTWLGFIDDVHIRIEDDATGRCRVEAESQSRVGKGDLGQNRRNLLEVHAFLMTHEFIEGQAATSR